MMNSFKLRHLFCKNNVVVLIKLISLFAIIYGIVALYKTGSFISEPLIGYLGIALYLIVDRVRS